MKMIIWVSGAAVAALLTWQQSAFLLPPPSLMRLGETAWRNAFLLRVSQRAEVGPPTFRRITFCQNSFFDLFTLLVISGSSACQTQRCSEDKKESDDCQMQREACRALPTGSVWERGPWGPCGRLMLNGCPGEVTRLIEDRLQGDGNAFALRLAPWPSVQCLRWQLWNPTYLFARLWREREEQLSGRSRPPTDSFICSGNAAMTGAQWSCVGQLWARDCHMWTCWESGELHQPPTPPPPSSKTFSSFFGGLGEHVGTCHRFARMPPCSFLLFLSHLILKESKKKVHFLPWMRGHLLPTCTSHTHPS